jgi:hypothetical protein
VPCEVRHIRLGGRHFDLNVFVIPADVAIQAAQLELNGHLDGGKVACDIMEDRADELVGLLAVAGVGKQNHTIRFVVVLNSTDVLGCPNVKVAPPKSRFSSNASVDQRIHLVVEGRGRRDCEVVVGGEG